MNNEKNTQKLDQYVRENQELKCCKKYQFSNNKTTIKFLGKSELEQVLNDLIIKKNSEEEELYGHFVAILNEKKLQIQHLRELLEAFRGGRSPTNPPVQIKSRKNNTKNPSNKQTNKNISISDSEESDNYNTDEESSNSPKENEQIEKNDPKYDFLEDDAPPNITLLPKRLKRESSDQTFSQPSTSKNTDNVPEIPKPPKKDSSDSPGIDFSTQDLLDML